MQLLSSMAITTRSLFLMLNDRERKRVERTEREESGENQENREKELRESI